MIAAKLARGAAKYALTLFIASVVIFVALRIVPGNPAEVALGVTATPEAVAKLSATMGIDKPLWEQYVSWIGGLLRGEFGTSLTSSTDISPIVADRLQVSLILVVLSMLFALMLAVPLGLWAARRSSHIDGILISALSQVGIAVPSFLAAILFISFLQFACVGCPPTVGRCPMRISAVFWCALCCRWCPLGLFRLRL